MNKPKSWYSIKAAAKGRAEISIYDEIGGWGITAKDFKASLDALGDISSLDVYISSPGGDVWQGQALYSILKRHPANVRVVVDGVAASAATLPAMAGDTVIVPENALLMIHEPWTISMGDADEMRLVVEMLEKAKATIVATYRAKTGLDDDRILELMAAETWMTGPEAVELGFADEVAAPVKLAAKVRGLNLTAKYRHVPDTLAKLETADMANPQAPEAPETTAPAAAPETTAPAVDLSVVADIAAACAEAGVAAMAAALIRDGLTLEQAQARITQAAEIKAACKLAKMPDKADAYIKAGLSLDAAKARLFEAMAKIDESTDTQSRILPAASATEKPIDPNAIYAARRK